MLTWNIDPVLLELGPLEIRYYGLFFALSLLLAYLLARSLCKQKKLSLDKLDELFLFLVIGLVLGARLGHALFYNFSYFLSNPLEIFQVWHGGLASHGGAIGALAGYGLFMWKEHRTARKARAKSRTKLPFFAYADILALAATIPVGMIRMGNFFNSEIVGRATDLPWSVQFLRVDELSRHPSQIYEFLIGAGLLAILYALWRKGYHKKTGFLTGLMITLYFACRFAVEFVKEYPTHDWAMQLTTGQLLSIPFFLFGLGMLWKATQRNSHR